MQQEKLLVVVPYRDREKHLSQFIPHISNTLRNQKIRFDIVISEQSEGSPFNRGLMCNIGFSRCQTDFDYVCFHDVDMISEDIDYRYGEHPTCLISQRKRGKIEKTDSKYFGGVTSLPKFTFQSINGFNNNYWGWGCEDDDLRERCVSLGIHCEQRDGCVIDLEIESNDSKISNNPNYAKNLNELRKFKRHKNKETLIRKNGLNNFDDYVNHDIKLSRKDDYIHLFADVIKPTKNF